MRGNRALLGLLAVGGVFFASLARANSRPVALIETDESLLADDLAADDEWFWNPVDWWSDMFPVSSEIHPISSNMRAFLYMIRVAETTKAHADSGEAYHQFYGFKRFANLADHPVTTGEMMPARLPDHWCKPAGFNPPCYTTASGAYQITRPTWNSARKSGAWGPRLPDFSPKSQDEAARRLIDQAGAAPLIEAGKLAEAIAAVSHLWASLPGSKAQQGGRDLSTLVAAYNEGLTRWG